MPISSRIVLFVTLWSLMPSIVIGDAWAQQQLGAFPFCPSVIAISQTGSTDLRTLISTGYICTVSLTPSDGESLSLVQGTGTMCATGLVPILGGTTASAGMPLAANSTLHFADASLVMTAPAQHLCLLQSGTGRVAGMIAYFDSGGVSNFCVGCSAMGVAVP